MMSGRIGARRHETRHIYSTGLVWVYFELRAACISGPLSVSESACGVVLVDSLLPGEGGDFGKNRVWCGVDFHNRV